MDEYGNDGIEAKVIKIVRECAGSAKRTDDADGAGAVSPASDLREDLNFDSLDLMMLVSELEAAFGSSLNDDDLKTVVTVGDIVAKIKEASRNA